MLTCHFLLGPTRPLHLRIVSVKAFNKNQRVFKVKKFSHIFFHSLYFFFKKKATPANNTEDKHLGKKEKSDNNTGF